MNLTVIAEAHAAAVQLRRYLALTELLAMDDEPDLRDRFGNKRGRHYVLPGDPHRKDTLKRDFSRAYLRHRMQARAGEDVSIIGVRRAVLRLVRTA